MKPLRVTLVLALLAVLALTLAPTAGAAAHKHRKPLHPPASARVEKVKLARTSSGRPALLVAVRYPIQAAGRRLRLGVRVQMKPGTVPLAQVLAHRLSAGPLRRPERRRTFTFVHEIDLKAKIAAGLRRAWHEGRSPLATVEAEGDIDIDGDGKADIRSKSIPRRVIHLVPPAKGDASASASGTPGPSAGRRFCASVPIVEVAPRGHLTIPLPACTQPVRWSVTSGASAGTAHLRDGELTYTAPATPGAVTIGLDHATVVVKVGRPWATLTPANAPSTPGPVVRAMGDSVTAGFGFYGNGSAMGVLELYECKPFGEVLDDACSSNSTATANGLKEVPYAADYGLSNNVSWAAQWANEYGITNYKNYAISGSEPTNWAPGGNLYPTTQKIEAEDPD